MAANQVTTLHVVKRKSWKARLVKCKSWKVRMVPDHDPREVFSGFIVIGAVLHHLGMISDLFPHIHNCCPILASGHWLWLHRCRFVVESPACIKIVSPTDIHVSNTITDNVTYMTLFSKEQNFDCKDQSTKVLATSHSNWCYELRYVVY